MRAKCLYLTLGQDLGFGFKSSSKGLLNNEAILVIDSYATHCFSRKSVHFYNIGEKGDQITYSSPAFPLKAPKSHQHTKGNFFKKNQNENNNFMWQDYLSGCSPYDKSIQGLGISSRCQFINQEMLLPTGHKNNPPPTQRSHFRSGFPISGQKRAPEVHLAFQREEERLLRDQ